MNLEILPVALDDLPLFHSLWRTIWPDRPRPLDEMRHDMTALPPEFRPTYWIAREDGEWVGYAEAERLPFSDDAWMIEVSVLAPYRRRGIGTALYEFVDVKLASESVRERFGRVSDDDPVSKAFGERRGYAERKRDFESQLDPTNVDPGLLARWSAPIPGVEIVPMAELDSSEFRQRLLNAIEAIRVDVPRATPPTPIAFEFFNEHVVGDPAFRWHGSFVALADGGIVGITGNFEGDTSEFLDQWLTGVLREWRGRGIAKSLKAHNARWAAANGVRTIRTDNDTRNASMLAINEAMGFVRKVGLITLGRKEDAREIGDPLR